MVSLIVDGYKGQRVDDRIFKSLHGLLMLLLPNERGTFTCEVNERTSDNRIPLDPYVHTSSEAEKGTDVRKAFAGRPVTDLDNL